MKAIVDLGGDNMVLYIDQRERWWIGTDFLLDAETPMEFTADYEHPFEVHGTYGDLRSPGLELDDDGMCSLTPQQARTLLGIVPMKLVATDSGSCALIDALRKAKWVAV